MTTITSELRAEIVSMTAEGASVAKIVKELKVKKAVVQAVLAEDAPALEAEAMHELSLKEDAATLVAAEVQAETIVADTVVDAPVQDDKKSLLAGLMQAAQAAPVDAPKAEAPAKKAPAIKASSSKDAEGNSRQRRNYEVSTRKVVIFFSDSLKQAHVTTHLAYSQKAYDSAIKYARRDLAGQKGTIPMAASADLRMELRDQVINVGEDLAVAKASVYDEVKAQGWEMIGRRGNAVVTAIIQPVAETETNTTEEVVGEEATA